eukprot:g1800.t1
MFRIVCSSLLRVTLILALNVYICFSIVIPPPIKDSALIAQSRVIVYFPDFHQSGGPAHFHQVHSGLNQLGFDSYFHFVNPHYVDEHMKNLTVVNIDQVSGRDIIIFPPNWDIYINKTEEMILRQRGARAVVLVTAVSYPEEQELLSLHNFTQGRAIPFAHSHYSHKTYQLPWDSNQFILWAPVEPWVIKEYEKYEIEKKNNLQPKKENLMSIDPDAKSEVMIPSMATHQVLFGLSRLELIDLFKKSKIIYDSYLNGHEHMPREAILFDCIPILTGADNGEDRVDFPFSSKFLMDELDPDRTNTLIEAMLKDYDFILPQFNEFKKSVLQRPTTLLKNLKATFASRRYQFKIDARTYIHEGYAFIAALRILTSLPLASVQISVRIGGVYRFMRRGGALTQRLVELGLTTANGGELYHSLRIVEDNFVDSNNFHGVHGDVIIRMSKPYYIYNFDALFDIVQQLIDHNACDSNFATDTKHAFIKILMVRSNKSSKIPCKSVENSNAIQLKGIAIMDLFGIELQDPILQEIIANDDGNNVLGMCKNICSLSQLPVWQSTGIFNRIFQHRNDVDDIKLYGSPKTFNMVDLVTNPSSYNNICKDYCVF